MLSYIVIIYFKTNHYQHVHKTDYVRSNDNVRIKTKTKNESPTDHDVVWLLQALCDSLARFVKPGNHCERNNQRANFEMRETKGQFNDLSL